MMRHLEVASEGATPRPSPALEEADVDAFRAFFVQHRARLVQASRLVMGSMAEGEEVAQEAFLKVWERWPRVRRMERPHGYLFRTALNVARRRQHAIRITARRTVTPRRTVDDETAVVDARDAVLRLLARLSPRRRAVLVLIEVLGFDTAEVASILEVQPGAVRTLVSRARADVERLLAEEEGGAG